MPDVTAVIRIDRQARQAAGGARRRRCWSSDAGATPEQAQRCLELADDPRRRHVLRRAVRALGVEDELLDEGLAELAAVVEGCAARPCDRVTVEANLRIARGLDYYTGTVVEIFMAGYERLKSVGGGGRYDALAERRPHDLPRRRRLVRRLPHARSRCSPTASLAGSRSVPSAVLVALVDEDSRPASDAVADALRARGIPCEVAASAAEVRQADPVRRAPRHPVRLVPRRPTAHEVKDIRSGRPGAGRPGVLEPADRGPATADREPADRNEENP